MASNKMTNLIPPNNQPDFVQDLLNLEDHDALDKYRFSTDCIHMWPFIRVSILLSCRNSLEGFHYEKFVDKSSASTEKRHNLLKDVTVENFDLDIKALSPSNAIVFTSASNRSVVNGMKRNIYSWPFEETLERILLVEDSPSGELSNHIDNVFWHEKIFQVARIKAKGNDPTDTEAKNISDLLIYLRSVYGHLCPSDIWSKLETQLKVMATRLPFWKQSYLQLISRIGPKFVVIDNASYGNRAFLIFWLKQCGIPVLEFQHGAINEGTPAYRHNSLPPVHWIHQYLPDQVLFWGENWLDKYQAELKKIVIGNPVFLEQKKQFKRISYHVLVCLNGFKPSIALPLLSEIANKFPCKKFKLRLHPVIRKNFHFWSEQLPENCFFCNDTVHNTLYEDLSNSLLVISEPSTVIYEALHLGIPTFVLQTTSWRYPVPNAEELLKRETLPQVTAANSPCEQYFGGDWKERLHTHLKSLI